MTLHLHATPLFSSDHPAPTTEHGLIMVYFAGGGGSSEGIRRATGSDVNYAINHSRDALGVHAINNANTIHLIEDVWDVDAAALTGGQPVYLAAFSPDCTNFSRSKNGVRRSRKLRSQIWVVPKTARAVRPRIIFVENVADIQKYGPLDAKGFPIREQEGRYYRSFLRQMEALGYTLEARVLNCADYGAATTRERWCLIARCDGQPIVWPEPTHGPANDPRVLSGERQPWISAGTLIDWTTPSPSVFSAKRRLCSSTLSRLTNGVSKYHLTRPWFVDQADQPGERVTASLCTYRRSKTDIGQDLHRPIRTITCVDGYALLTMRALPLRTPLTAEQAARAAQVHAAMRAHVPPEDWAGQYDDAARQVTFTENGEQYVIHDLAMRFLTGRELFDLSGFGPEYEITRSATGGRVSHRVQVELVGNAVPPPLYEAITLANAHELRGEAAD